MTNRTPPRQPTLDGSTRADPRPRHPDSGGVFHPPLWARGPNAQTLLGRVLRPRAAPELRRERWTTPDGDFLDLDFTPDPDPSAPLVLVLHGLEGSSRRGYVLAALAAARRKGAAGVALNFRGCSGKPNLRSRAYHSGETDDPLFVLERLRDRFPGRPFGAVGFSLGGNVLLKLLGEKGTHAGRWLTAAATISVPFDLAAGAEQLETTRWGRLYAGHFLRSLKRKVRDRAQILREKVDVDRTLESRTIREFDDAHTAPLHGFRDADHYYSASSAAAHLEDVRIPTLLIQSMDDPFLPRPAIPEARIRRNSYLVPRFSPRGGHVGFVDGTPWSPRFWAEEEAIAFLMERFSLAPSMTSGAVRAFRERT